MRRKLASQRIRPQPSKGGGLGAFLLPEVGRRVTKKQRRVSLLVAVPPVWAVEVEAEPALPSYSHFPLPEYLRRMFSHSPIFFTVWQQAAGVAFFEGRLLIRAQRLHQLLGQLRTTRYRMEQHGLQAFCRLGCRTTLYRLGEVLAVFILAAHKTDELTLKQMVPDLEQIIFDGLLEKFGPEVHAKDISNILGGAKSREHATSLGELVPSVRKHRCVLFPLQALEQAVQSLVSPVTATLPKPQQSGRTR